MKALCVGHSAFDITAASDTFPAENTKNRFGTIVESSGGCGVNMAYLLGKYGVESYIASTVGDDTYGNIIRKDLEKVGVHTEYMETAYDKRTSLNFIMIAQKTASRTMYDVTKEKLYLKKTDFQMDPDVVIVDGYDYGASLAALNFFSSKITIICAGEYNSEIVELCKNAKYVVASREFAEACSGNRIDYENPQSLVTVYSSLLNKFIGKEIIVTLEDKGAMYMKENQIKVMPGLTLKSVDPTGAGDYFRAAFGYALASGYDLERAITFANVAGGLAVTKVGARESVPELSDIMIYYNQKYGEFDAQKEAAASAPAETPAPEENAAPAPETAPAQTETAQVSPAPAPSPEVAPSPAVAPTPQAPVAPPVTPAAPAPSAEGQVQPPVA